MAKYDSWVFRQFDFMKEKYNIISDIKMFPKETNLIDVVLHRNRRHSQFYCLLKMYTGDNPLSAKYIRISPTTKLNAIKGGIASIAHLLYFKQKMEKEHESAN